MIKFLEKIENVLIGIRDFFWDYPDTFFLNKNSVTKSSKQIYLKSRPFSHAILLLIVFGLIGTLIMTDATAILSINKDTYIEGVIVGQDQDGNIQKVMGINPLVVTSTQIKRDIADLIYEPLLKVDQNNRIQLVLAESYADIGEGKAYRVKLKEGVQWHDGKEFTADDVIATFNLLQDLDLGNQTSSVYSKASTKLEINKIDKYRIDIMLKDQNTVMPTFFEAISFKILPKRLVSSLNSNNILYAETAANANPVGTGPFIAGALDGDRITLTRNEKYYAGVAKLKNIVFRLYKNQEQAVDDLKTGQIHALTGINSDELQNLGTIPNLVINRSNVFYNQYWALYFNLSDRGKAVLKDKNVRQAVAYSINMNLLIDALVDSGVEAHSPIPETSFAYVDYDKYGYDPSTAIALLEKSGWTLQPGNQFRTDKDGNVLSFEILYVKNVDREKVMTVIKRNLESIGIQVNTTGKTIAEVNSDYLVPSYFDILLYGVSTFIDPDRYELFHSSQIGYPNLNISSYKSSLNTIRISQGKKQTISQVDYALEKGRSLIDQQARKAEYDKFQKIVMDDLPVIYLYHPVYTYVVNKRVKGITLDNMVTLEDRFNNVTSWEIKV